MAEIRDWYKLTKKAGIKKDKHYNQHMIEKKGKRNGRDGKKILLSNYSANYSKITGMGGFKGFRIIRLKILKPFFK